MRPILLLAVLALVGACVGAGPTASPSAQPPSAPPSAPPTATASPPVATLEPPAETLSGNPGPPPAAAVLVLPDGTTVNGRIGSWCSEQTCAEVPVLSVSGLPAVTLPEAGTKLAARLPESYAFWSWSALYGPSTQTAWDTLLGRGGSVIDPDIAPPTDASPLTEAEFDGPPSGDWALALQVQFVASGDALYYWHVVVP